MYLLSEEGKKLLVSPRAAVSNFPELETTFPEVRACGRVAYTGPKKWQAFSTVESPLPRRQYRLSVLMKGAALRK